MKCADADAGWCMSGPTLFFFPGLWAYRCSSAAYCVRDWWREGSVRKKSGVWQRPTLRFGCWVWISLFIAKYNSIPKQPLGKKVGYVFGVPASGNACSGYKIISHNTHSIYKLIFCDFPLSIKYGKLSCWRSDCVLRRLLVGWQRELVAMLQCMQSTWKLNQDWSGMNGKRTKLHLLT